MRFLFLSLLPLSLAAADDFEAQLARKLLENRQPLIEAQIHLGARVPAMPLTPARGAWETHAASLRRQILDNVVFRGQAASWRTLSATPEWLDVLPGDGYRVRKFRYQILPGWWMPGLLYEPAKLSGRMPAAINVNGHEGAGVSIDYIQQRCIHLARNGVLAFNYEWFGKGQMSGKDYEHSRMNQLDLTGTSGLAPFFLAHQRLLDIALQHPNTDPERVLVTGLSGGGWQTIILSSLDPRVKMAVPVAGYSSFVTRTQFDKDLGDSEQTPVDLGRYADYTHLTAMLAPRPALLIYNAYDDCCFRAEYAVSPLAAAAKPFYALYGAAGKLRRHDNFDAGHNYGPDNRRALYRFINEFFLASGKKISETEDIPSGAVRSADQLRMTLPSPNHDFHSLALQLASGLPRPSSGAPDQRRSKLREILRWPEYRVEALPAGAAQPGSMTVTGWRLRMDGEWTVPAVEFAPANASGATILIGDGGRAKLAAEVRRLVAQNRRVLALDPFYFGESTIETKAYLYALLVSSLGERALGVQAGQVAAAARWMTGRGGPTSVEGHGPRASVIALAAAAADPQALAGGVRTFGAMRSLREVIERDMPVTEAPELFCFGLLEWFDMPQLKELVAPRPVETEGR